VPVPRLLQQAVPRRLPPPDIPILLLDLAVVSPPPSTAAYKCCNGTTTFNTTVVFLPRLPQQSYPSQRALFRAYHLHAAIPLLAQITCRPARAHPNTSVHKEDLRLRAWAPLSRCTPAVITVAVPLLSSDGPQVTHPYGQRDLFRRPRTQSLSSDGPVGARASEAGLRRGSSTVNPRACSSSMCSSSWLLRIRLARLGGRRPRCLAAAHT